MAAINANQLNSGTKPGTFLAMFLARPAGKLVVIANHMTQIKAPSNGKEVSQKEYDEIVVKKMEEMQEMNNGRGGGFQMRMTR